MYISVLNITVYKIWSSCLQTNTHTHIVTHKLGTTRTTSSSVYNGQIEWPLGGQTKERISPTSYAGCCVCMFVVVVVCVLYVVWSLGSFVILHPLVYRSHLWVGEFFFRCCEIALFETHANTFNALWEWWCSAKCLLICSFRVQRECAAAAAYICVYRRGKRVYF